MDPLRDILDAREGLRREGLDFAIHPDAAWGGYFNTMYLEDAGLGAPPEFPMSEYVGTQYHPRFAKQTPLPWTRTRQGLCPMPREACVIATQRCEISSRSLAPVVFHNELEPTVGIYGIEGSKPGAAATAVYLAHKVIRPTKHGYGKILGQCVWVSKRMYCRLLTMEDRDPKKAHRLSSCHCKCCPPNSADRGPEFVVKRERDMVASFVPLTNKELKKRLENQIPRLKRFSRSWAPTK